MITIPTGVRVMLATRPVDLRRGAHSLAALAAASLGQDPFLCVELDYVAAHMGAAFFHGFAVPGRHII